MTVAGLTGFVALTGDQHHITGRRPRHGVLDRRAPVADLDHFGVATGFGCAGEDFAPDFRRVLAAGVVVGHYHQISQLGCGAAHLGPFTRVAIAAGTEYDGEPAEIGRAHV